MQVPDESSVMIGSGVAAAYTSQLTSHVFTAASGQILQQIISDSHSECAVCSTLLSSLSTKGNIDFICHCS